MVIDQQAGENVAAAAVPGDVTATVATTPPQTGCDKAGTHRLLAAPPPRNSAALLHQPATGDSGG